MSPYLFISPLIIILFQIVSSQFLIIKKSYFISISLVLGALINVILNYYLIKKMGIEGAAVATIIGYLFSLGIVGLVAAKDRLIIINYRIILSFLISILSTIFIKLFNIQNSFPLVLLISCITIIIILLL